MNYIALLAACAAVLASSTADAFTTVPIIRGLAKPRSSVSLSATEVNQESLSIFNTADEFDNYSNQDGNFVFDAALVYPIDAQKKKVSENLVFLFSGEVYLKWNYKNNAFRINKKEGTPKQHSIKDNTNRWEGFPFDRVDAVLVFKKEKNYAYFFCGTEYVEINLDDGEVVGNSKSIKDLEGMPFEKIDAVLDYPKDCPTIFSGEKYIKWDLKDMKWTGGVSKISSGFQGYPFERVDAALVIPKPEGRDRAYLFFEGKYVEWDLVANELVDSRRLKNVRFNKCPPIDEIDEGKKIDDTKKFDPKVYVPNLYNKGVHRDVYPLLPADYNPLRTADILKEETESDSVVIAADIQLDQGYILPLEEDAKERIKAEDWVTDTVTGASVKPIFPGDFKGTFWKEFEKVLTAQERRIEEDNITPDGEDDASQLYRWPDIWYDRTDSTLNTWPRDNKAVETLTLEDVAQSVKGEFSNYHQQRFLRTLKANLATDMGGEFRSKRDFLGMQVRMAVINAWSLEAVGPINFFLKWNYGMPRPEEVAWLIKSKKLTTDEGVPQNIIDIVGPKGTMEFESATDFTAYPDGCPTHPSFPAMHSAGSTCSLWLPALYDISGTEYLEALRLDYGVAFARTVAGVHYPQDNIAGLNIGQRIIREKLPRFLADNYGYDAGKVESKLKSLSFDWNDFDSKKGTIKDTPAANFLEAAR